MTEQLTCLPASTILLFTLANNKIITLLIEYGSMLVLVL